MNPEVKQKLRWFVGLGVVLFVGGAAVCFGIPQVREGLFGDNAKAAALAPGKIKPAELITVGNEQGLKLSKEAIDSLGLKPTEAVRAVKERPIPPLIGTVNYDNERLFVLGPRFAGAIEEIKQVPDSEYPQGPKKARPIRYGDRIEQGDTLAVLWSRDLGEKKAALVDAICALNLSRKQMEEQRKAVAAGAFPLVGLLATERQVQADNGAMLTAERTLRMWKLPDAEIEAVKNEAKTIIDSKKIRDAETEKNWARVEIKAPRFSDDSKRRLVIVEKNVNLGYMADPGRDSALFKLADLSRLQIWVHPPEEYYPLLRERLKAGPGALKWHIRFQAEPANTPPLELDVAQIAPSLEPSQHTPMLIGYLDNAEGKHLIGQFVTATIFVPPPPDTVEIPTDAINPLNGQEFVFVENPAAKDEFLIRRVLVVQSFKNTSLVRAKLTPEEEKTSQREEALGRYPIKALLPGDRVVTRGAVELTAALEELRSTKEHGK